MPVSKSLRDTNGYDIIFDTVPRTDYDIAVSSACGGMLNNDGEMPSTVPVVELSNGCYFPNPNIEASSWRMHRMAMESKEKLRMKIRSTLNAEALKNVDVKKHTPPRNVAVPSSAAVGGSAAGMGGSAAPSSRWKKVKTAALVVGLATTTKSEKKKAPATSAKRTPFEIQDFNMTTRSPRSVSGRPMLWDSKVKQRSDREALQLFQTLQLNKKEARSESNDDGKGRF